MSSSPIVRRRAVGVERGAALDSSQSEFLIGLAEVAGTLLGTFLVGVFFYLDLGARRSTVADNRYLRAGVRSVFALYAIPLLVPIALLAVGPVWGALVFAVLAVVLVMTAVATARLVLTPRGVRQATTLIVNEWLGIAAVLVLVALPWILGGFTPQPSDFNASYLLALAAGFASTVTLIMKEFDAKRRLPEEVEEG